MARYVVNACAARVRELTYLTCHGQVCSRAHVSQQAVGHLANHADTTRGASKYGRSVSTKSSCLCTFCKEMSASCHAAEGRPRMRAHRLQTSGSAISLRRGAAKNLLTTDADTK